ncbi:MAG: MFS transporter [Firmicutes bacterium]|nr:MFS transporter [Bacillota bacterium]
MPTTSTVGPSLRFIIIALACVMFIMGSDLNIVAPFLVPMSHSFRVPVQSVGWLITCFALGYALGSPVAGYASDRFGRYPALAVGMALFITAETASGLAPTLALEVAARTLAGMAAGAVSPIAYAWIGDVVPDRWRAGAMATLSMGFSLSTVAGVPLGLWLADAVGWRGTLVAIGAALFFIGSILIPWLRHLASPQAHVRATPFAVAPYYRLLARTWPQLLASFTAFAAIGLVYSYLPTALLHHGLPAKQLLLVLGGYGMFNLMGNAYFGRLGDRRGPRFAVISAQLVELVALAALTVTTLYFRLIAIIGAALAFALSQAYIPDLKALASEVTPAVRGTSLALNNTAMYLGLVAGSGAANQLYRPGTFPLISGAAIIAVVIGFLGIKLTRKAPHRLFGT